MEKDFILESSGGVTTSSRMRVWWLTTFQGYQVRCVSAQPQKSSLGIVQFVNHWELEVPEEETAQD